MKRSLLILLLLLPVLLSAQKLASRHTEAILAVMDMQEKAWNQGDIPTFMQGYWHSDSLKFIGSNGITYGWQATNDRYLSRYPDRKTMGTLTFTILHLEATGPNSAWMAGKWHLSREIGDVGGHFTLLWRRIDGKWVIVSDHTS
ncbi:MAG: nuclear transport factor 2 family protein [Bacteroidetes bacterium]|nr:MAG: nuclear transport factor 2 family protein [Bacteroidota bacterium]